MEPTHIPGKEPDTEDVTTEPGRTEPSGPDDHNLPDPEAEGLGDFA